MKDTRARSGACDAHVRGEGVANETALFGASAATMFVAAHA